MTKTSFSELGLIEPILRALRAEGYERPTPIQTESIPHVLASRDVLGCAQTGTGKTAAFALPILQMLQAKHGDRRPEPKRPLVLVLSPTRELAAQIADSFKTYGRNLRLSHTVIFGGVGQSPQVQALQRGVHVVVATPGRLLDLINQGHVHLDRVEIAVLDEADRMLDMGFLPDVERILARLPKKRQSLLFSATMPREIALLADELLDNPVKIAVDPVASTTDQVEQHVLFVAHADKRALLGDLLADPRIERALVFTRTKHGANKVAKHLAKSVVADAIHGNKSQTARTKALEGFKRGRIRVLVATDIAARGIDVEGVTHVINYDLPNVPESYVHRIGRTARAGADGAAISFCASDERPYLKSIEKLIQKRLKVLDDHPYHERSSSMPPPPPPRRGRPNERRSPGRR